MTTLVKPQLLPELDAMERSFRRIFEGIPMMPAFVSPVTPPPTSTRRRRSSCSSSRCPATRSGARPRGLGSPPHDHGRA